MQSFKTRLNTVVLLLCTVLVCVVSCNSTISDESSSEESNIIIYKLFELKPDDIRLKYLHHPLFSFEYPEVFILVDLNKIPGHPMRVGESNVVLTCYQPDLPKQSLSIRVLQKSDSGLYKSADGIFDFLISSAQDSCDTITTKTVIISGITADYIETFGSREASVYEDTTIFPSSKTSGRFVVFEYTDLIWTIVLRWYYYDSEPLEVEGYFNHVIETFKILD